MKQTTKDESLVQWKRKISCKPGKNFVKCSHLNVPPLPCSQNCSALFVGLASSLFLLFAAPPNFYCDFPICKRKLVDRKTTTPKSMQVHKRKGHLKLLCSLTRQAENCECHPAYSFLFINKFVGYMLLFHQSTMRIIYCV